MSHVARTKPTYIHAHIVTLNRLHGSFVYTYIHTYIQTPELRSQSGAGGISNRPSPLPPGPFHPQQMISPENLAAQLCSAPLDTDTNMSCSLVPACTSVSVCVCVHVCLHTHTHTRTHTHILRTLSLEEKSFSSWPLRDIHRCTCARNVRKPRIT